MGIFNDPAFLVVALVAIGGWVFTTWLRVRHGYSLEGTWGQEFKPGATAETTERIRLLTAENARFAAELGAVTDRLAVLERIVTDRSSGLATEIDSLRH
jgi:hypothetical protein